MLIVFHKVTARDWPCGRYNYQLTDSGKQIQIIKFYLPKNIKACFLAGSVAAGAATFFMPCLRPQTIQHSYTECHFSYFTVYVYTNTVEMFYTNHFIVKLAKLSFSVPNVCYCWDFWGGNIMNEMLFMSTICKMLRKNSSVHFKYKSWNYPSYADHLLII